MEESASSPGLGEYAKPYHGKVEKNTKGYNWTASVSGDDMQKVLDDLYVMEAELKARYGGATQ